MLEGKYAPIRTKDGRDAGKRFDAHGAAHSHVPCRAGGRHPLVALHKQERAALLSGDLGGSRYFQQVHTCACFSMCLTVCLTSDLVVVAGGAKSAASDACVAITGAFWCVVAFTYFRGVFILKCGRGEHRRWAPCTSS